MNADKRRQMRIDERIAVTIDDIMSLPTNRLSKIVMLWEKGCMTTDECIKLKREELGA